jgi:hypothetical protein
VKQISSRVIVLQKFQITGKREEMQNNKLVPIGSPKGQTEPMGVKEQLINFNWLSHTKERTDVICRKTIFFITTAVRNSNPTAV